MVPKGVEMPLHDHNGMQVFINCIRGDIKVDIFDFCDRLKFYEDLNNKEYLKLTSVGFPVNYFGQSIYREGNNDVLHPHHNNIHRFYAETNTMLIELKFNDYDEERSYNTFEEIDKTRLKLNLVNHEKV